MPECMNRHTKINVRYDNDKFSEQTSQNLKFLLRKKLVKTNEFCENFFSIENKMSLTQGSLLEICQGKPVNSPVIQVKFIR